ncbi:cupin domain-containing protein [Marinobacterium rhizophilum]|uniref:cupin domain-containing protein n=1 Tax=Marinobacterium rhizophilum TaxID=420402 RepID=UPI00036719C6|nr:cupin domain-containing protein [Marinobacterium rhizophilum]
MNRFFIDETQAWEELGGGIRRKLVSWTDSLMAVLVEFDEGAIGEPHAHELHDQIAYVIRGRFEVEVAGERRVLQAGDAFTAPKSDRHGVVALEAGSRLMDLFSPKRDDFLDSGGY